MLEEAEVLILLDKEELDLKSPIRLDSLKDSFIPKFNEESFEYISFCFG